MGPDWKYSKVLCSQIQNKHSFDFLDVNSAMIPIENFWLTLQFPLTLPGNAKTNKHEFATHILCRGLHRIGPFALGYENTGLGKEFDFLIFLLYLLTFQPKIIKSLVTAE